jgi:DNA-binding MarR family transcriptional regulator
MNANLKNSLSTFQKTKDQTDHRVLLSLLSALGDNPQVSQRRLAGDLGVALGLINTYLKRCVVKGWIRAREVSPQRISYFLTPEGFSEKSRMVADYLSRSLHFFRDAKHQCDAAFSVCLKNEWKNIALVGAGDLRDIAVLVADGAGVCITLVDIANDINFGSFDAILITDVTNPQAIYDSLKGAMPKERLILMELLHVSDHEFEMERGA